MARDWLVKYEMRPARSVLTENPNVPVPTAEATSSLTTCRNAPPPTVPYPPSVEHLLPLWWGLGGWSGWRRGAQCISLTEDLTGRSGVVVQAPHQLPSHPTLLPVLQSWWRVWLEKGWQGTLDGEDVAPCVAFFLRPRRPMATASIWHPPAHNPSFLLTHQPTNLNP